MMRPGLPLTVRDARGQAFDPDAPPRRIVSLVPSVTETLFDFGCGDRLAARTDFCVHPAAAADVPSIGGTKNPDLAAIRALRPDLIFANQEENRRSDVEALEAAGLRVFVAFPRDVLQAIRDLETLAGWLGVSPAALDLVRSIRKMWRNARTHLRPVTSAFVPIWRDPWMTFNAVTFAHDVLSLLGVYNIFADRDRRYPLAADLNRAEPRFEPDRDTRYPRITLDEAGARRPRLILLPDEPYRFSPADAQELARALDLSSDRVRLIDGSLLFWHGTRLSRALRELPAALAV